jgi:hypothetical protein
MTALGRYVDISIVQRVFNADYVNFAARRMPDVGCRSAFSSKLETAPVDLGQVLVQIGVGAFRVAHDVPFSFREA